MISEYRRTCRQYRTNLRQLSRRLRQLGARRFDRIRGQFSLSWRGWPLCIYTGLIRYLVSSPLSGSDLAGDICDLLWDVPANLDTLIDAIDTQSPWGRAKLSQIQQTYVRNMFGLPPLPADSEPQTLFLQTPLGDCAIDRGCWQIRLRTKYPATFATVLRPEFRELVDTWIWPVVPPEFVQDMAAVKQAQAPRILGPAECRRLRSIT